MAAARDAGVPVAVDGAHAPGMLPVDVGGTGADFWVGNLHKWAYAPRGTAVLAVAPAWRERIEPLVVSWEQPTGFPARVEWQATLDYTPWLAAPIGLFTMRNLGVDAVRAHNVALAAYGQAVVGAALDVPPDDLPDPGPGVSMRLVPLPAGLATDWTEAAALRQRIADDLATEVGITHVRRPWLAAAQRPGLQPGRRVRPPRRTPARLPRRAALTRSDRLVAEPPPPGDPTAATAGRDPATTGRSTDDPAPPAGDHATTVTPRRTRAARGRPRDHR